MLSTKTQPELHPVFWIPDDTKSVSSRQGVRASRNY